MSHSYRRPYQIARALELSSVDVVTRIRAAGVTVAEAGSLIQKEDLARVFDLFGIDVIAGPSPKPKARRPKEAPEADEPAVAAPAPPKARRTPRLKPTKKPKMGLVGHPVEAMTYLTANDVEKIHWCLVEDFGRARDPIDPPGVKDRNMLESALFRVHTSLDATRKYPTVAMAAAAYLHALIGDHPFHNGNKRTALVAVLVFLDLNSYVLEAEENQLFDYLLSIASHSVAVPIEGESLADVEMNAVAKWLNGRCRPLSTLEHPLKFHQFREILTRFGCTFDHAQRGNRINVYRGGKRVQVYYRNEGTDVEINTIRLVRTDLGLLERDGYDSFIFYNAKRRIPDFIQRYRHTLDRLAKV